MTPSEKETRNLSATRLQGWELLVWLWLAFFFNQADRQIFNVLLPLIKSDLGLSDAQLGLIASLFVLCVGLCTPIAGFVGDLFSKRRIIILSLLFWSLATVCTGMSISVWHLIIFRSLSVGGGEAFYAPSANAYICEYHKNTRALAMSVHQTSLYIGVIMSGIVGGYVAEHYGWRTTFVLFGGIGIALAVLMAWRLPPVLVKAVPSTLGEQKAFVAKATSVLLHNPSAMLLGTAFVCLVFVNVGYLTWAPSFLHEKFRLSIMEAGFSSMFYHHICAFAGIVGGGLLSDKLGAKSPRYRLMIQAAGLLLGAPFIYGLGQAESTTMTYACLGGFGFFRGIYEANFIATLFEVIEPKFRASVVGLIYLFVFTIGSLSPFLLGYFKASLGLSDGLSALSVAYVIGGAAVWVVLRWCFARDRIREEA